MNTLDLFNDTLFLFDIDDTLTNSMSRGSQCFAQTFSDLFGIDGVSINWSDYPHVTDWGLTYSLFKEHFERPPTKWDLSKIEEHYNGLLQKTYKIPDSISPIEGAFEFCTALKNKNIPIALATGGWSFSAQLKLSRAGYKFENLPLGSSNDAWSRDSIMKAAIQKARTYYQKTLRHVIYFGDGVWDFHTCHKVNIPLIGIDIHQNNRLKNLGLKHVYPNFLTKEEILSSAKDLLRL
jgi:phosphoglycolate phosphatase-like HAD superfamily hydrolase